MNYANKIDTMIIIHHFHVRLIISDNFQQVIVNGIIPYVGMAINVRIKKKKLLYNNKTVKFKGS